MTESFSRQQVLESAQKLASSYELNDEIYSKMTSDRFIACMLSNEETARYFLQFVLPSNISEQLDFETLKCNCTKLNTERGEERIGDFFFSIKVKPSVDPKGRIETFVIILEHKSYNDRGAALQVLSYQVNLLYKMWQNKKEWSIDGEKLSAPYPILFSQDWSEADPPTLRDLVTTLPGLEDTIPDFKFQIFKICRSRIEEILKCDALTALFLYLELLANKPQFEPEKEARDLAVILERCVKQTKITPRLEFGINACLVYWNQIIIRRPQTPSSVEVFEKMEQIQLLPEETQIYRVVFPKAVKAFDTKVKKLEEQVEKANESKREAQERERLANAILKEYLLEDVITRFPSKSYEQIDALISSIDDYPTFSVARNIIKSARTMEELTIELQRLLSTK